MKIIAGVCKLVGYTWLGLAVLIIGVSSIWVLVDQGFSAFAEMFSPYNFANFLLTAIVLAPGFGLLMLADKLRGRAEKLNN